MAIHVGIDSTASGAGASARSLSKVAIHDRRATVEDMTGSGSLRDNFEHNPHLRASLSIKTGSTRNKASVSTLCSLQIRDYLTCCRRSRVACGQPHYQASKIRKQWDVDPCVHHTHRRVTLFFTPEPTKSLSEYALEEREDISIHESIKAGQECWSINCVIS